VPEVLDVHDLHIWSLTHGEPSLSVHLSIPPGADANKTLLRVQHVLRQKGIMHSTVQIEIVDTPDCEDKDCAADDENPNCEGFAIKCADHQCNDFM
jgi:cobalt-zinc-cadmium efflux system protein